MLEPDRHIRPRCSVVSLLDMFHSLDLLSDISFRSLSKTFLLEVYSQTRFYWSNMQFPKDLTRVLSLRRFRRFCQHNYLKANWPIVGVRSTQLEHLIALLHVRSSGQSADVNHIHHFSRTFYCFTTLKIRHCTW